MYLIYLDSNISRELGIYSNPHAKDPRFDAIYSKLIDLVSTGIAICPMPLETIVESSHLDQDHRMKLDHFFRKVSGGLMFVHLWDIVADRTLQLIRPNHKVHHFMHYPEGWGRLDEAAATAEKIKREQYAIMKENMHKFTEVQGSKGGDVDRIFLGAARQRAEIFRNDLLRFHSHPNAQASEYHFGTLIKKLKSKGLTEHEAWLLTTKMADWLTMECNMVELRIAAEWEAKFASGQAYKVNDEIDRWRITLGLCYTHLVITDAKAARLGRKIVEAGGTSTEIFDIKELNEIELFLRSIGNSEVV